MLRFEHENGHNLTLNSIGSDMSYHERSSLMMAMMMISVVNSVTEWIIFDWMTIRLWATWEAYDQKHMVGCGPVHLSEIHFVVMYRLFVGMEQWSSQGWRISLFRFDTLPKISKEANQNSWNLFTLSSQKVSTTSNMDAQEWNIVVTHSTITQDKRWAARATVSCLLVVNISSWSLVVWFCLVLIL